MQTVWNGRHELNMYEPANDSVCFPSRRLSLQEWDDRGSVDAAVI